MLQSSRLRVTTVGFAEMWDPLEPGILKEPSPGPTSSLVPPLPLPDNLTLTTPLEVLTLTTPLEVSFALWGPSWERASELGPSIPMDTNYLVGWVPGPGEHGCG